MLIIPELTIGIRPEPVSSRLRMMELAPEVSTIVTGRRRPRSPRVRRVARLDADPVVRDHDLVVVAQHRALLHLHAVDERAVVRAQVLERPAVALLPQPRVLAGHAHVRDEDLTVRAAPDDVLAIGQLVPPSGDRSGQEHQRWHV